MKKLLIILLLLITTVALAEEKYIWESPVGKLRWSDQNEDILIFDTYEPLTPSKDVIVSWNEMNRDKIKVKLTDKAFELHQKLFKSNDVLGVSVSYRAILIQKFPLTSKEEFVKIVIEVLK